MSPYGPNEHDILIIGGGGAGLRAAIAAVETNPRLNVAVISKVYPMRSYEDCHKTTNGHSVSRVTVKPMLLALALLAV